MASEKLYPVPVGEGRWIWTVSAFGAALGAAIAGKNSRAGAAAGAVLGAWLAAKYVRPG